MALILFDDFEDGTVDDDYPGKTGNGWTISPNDRANGVGPPAYRPSPDPTFFIQAPSGVSGDQAIGFVGNSAWTVEVHHEISDGLGCYFYSNEAGPDDPIASSGKVSIGWADLYANQGGSFSVDRHGPDLEIELTWFLDAAFESDSDAVTVTDFLAVEGTADTGLWLEVRFNRADGWLIRNATSGATIASGTYPWAMPSLGMAWDLSLYPNDDGPLFPYGSSRMVIDNIYGYPGRDRSLPVVRKYPRDDEYGFAGGRRIYPPPRINRIVGRQS